MKSSRYIRQTALKEVGLEGQTKLTQKHVCVVGAGGLGIPAALYLTGAGIGNLHLIDFDVVEESNLNRQVIYKENDLGKAKVEVLAQHLRLQNSTINVTAINQKLSKENALNLLESSDIVLDCSDNMRTRFLINDACVILNKAFVSAAVYKFEGQVGVFNYNGGPTYRCLFNLNEKIENIPSCAESGVIGTIPGVLGTIQANEVIKMILNMEGILSGKILLMNLLSYNTSFFNIIRNERNVQAIKEQGFNGLENVEIKSEENYLIDKEKLVQILKKGDIQFVDVREDFESPEFNTSEIIRLPISEGFDQTNRLKKSKTVVCFCQSGIRSIQAAQILRQKGYDAFSLQNGIEEIMSANLFSIKNTVVHE